jgi:hypothetical protein
VDAKLARFDKLSDEEKQQVFAKVMDGKHKAMADIAHQIAKIDHLNKQKPDRFLEVLLPTRPDLQGLRWVMGDACRLTKTRSSEFTRAAFLVRAAMAEKSTPAFWKSFAMNCAEDDRDDARERPVDDIAKGRMAALMQMLGAEPAGYHVGLAEHLSDQSNEAATHALARLAVFSPDDTVRRAAIGGLRKRDPKDYSSILVAGLRYPWPGVARQAADAVADLERRELVPELVRVLDEPDPRAPAIQEAKGQKTTVAREVVRINHHRNCLLCHAPGIDAESRRGSMVAAVPTPDLPLESPSRGYALLSPDVVVRADVTYLRQDFSMMQKVENPGPWPALQRYDFLVRTRTLSAAEAAELRKALASTTATPYRNAALSALRRLTGANPGGNPGVTGEAWKKWLAAQKG